MRKKYRKKPREQIIKYKNNNISQENMIEIHAEAYYRALKKIEQEKTNHQEQKQERTKYTWYMELLLMLNLVLFPWKISKKFNINNQIYDSVLVFFVSMALCPIGMIVWILGAYEIIQVIKELTKVGISYALVIRFGIGLVCLVLGSIFVLAGKTFSEEEDSNKIYAYSASIIAMLSFAVSIITLVKK